MVSASPGTPFFDFYHQREWWNAHDAGNLQFILFITIEKMNLGLVLLYNNVLAQALIFSLSWLVVFMQLAKSGNLKATSPSNSSSTKGTSVTDIVKPSVTDVKVNEDKPEKSISRELLRTG